MMRDFGSCFSENVVEFRDPKRNSGENSHNMISCVYHTRAGGYAQLITVTWMKNNTAGRRFSIEIDSSGDHCLGFFKVERMPWLLSKRKGSKIFESGIGKVGIHWDLSLAKFETGVPEPSEKYYVAVIVNLELVLLVGDMIGEAYKKIKFSQDKYPLTNMMIIAKKKYTSGDKHYSTRSKFCKNGATHDITIDCETSGSIKEPYLEIRVDKKRIVLVKRLEWNFRGNQTILIDDLPVEVFWDVHSWLFGSSNRRPGPRHAMFMFQTSGHSSEQTFPWYYHQKFRESQMDGQGFSLIIFASTGKV